MLIFLLIGFICMIFAILIVKILYTKLANKNILNSDYTLEMSNMAVILNAPYLKFSNGFSNITCNLILKYIVFVVFSLIMYFVNSASGFINILYIIYFSLETLKWFKRLNQFIKARNRKLLSIIFFAFTILFIYHFILFSFIAVMSI